MLVVGIKSRPVYKGLVIDIHSARHLFALEGEGAEALLDQIKSVGSGFLEKAEILYVGPDNQAGKLRDLKSFDFWTAPTIPVLLNRLKASLQAARMGTRLYLSGTEGFIGQAMQVALDLGIDFNSIRTEHRGSTARRVQCVHCKGITDNVTTSPFTCSPLRPAACWCAIIIPGGYGAFQGVNIDAEEPGSAPKPEVLFP